MSEVAAGVTFLCSKDASFVNATDLKVWRWSVVNIEQVYNGHQVDGGYGAMSAEGFGPDVKPWWTFLIFNYDLFTLTAEHLSDAFHEKLNSVKNETFVVCFVVIPTFASIWFWKDIRVC